MRTSRVLPLLIALVLLLAGGAFWLLGSTESAAPAAAAGASGAQPRGVGPASPVAATELEAPPEKAATSLVDTPASAGSQRQAATTGRQVSVTVTPPAGTPTDPELTVLAVPLELLGGRSVDSLLEALRTGEESELDVVRAAVVGGRAQLQLPESLGDAQLVVDGRFLYLPEPVPVTAAAELVLRPRLGACLSVRLQAPEGAQLEGEVSLVGASFSRGPMGQARYVREALSTGVIEYRAVDPDMTWMLRFEVQRLHAYSELGVELEPGVPRTLDIELTRGVTVAGRVVDEEQAPLSGIEVRADTGGMRFGQQAPGAVTDAEGEFELVALGPGELLIEAVSDGWISARSEELELAEGERQDGLLLVMERGLAIAGRVQRPDGSGASGAEVTLRSGGGGGGGFGNWGGGRSRQVGQGTCDETGRFRVTGLREGPHTVSATLEVIEDQPAVTWRADEDAIEAGREDVLLTLAGPISFAGRVVDDRGEELGEFELRARGTRSGGPSVTQEFESEDGSFVFGRVGPGEWEVTASAEGHERSEPITVTLPGATADLELTLQRRCSIAGMVTDSTGAAIANATVQSDTGSQAGNPWGGPQGPRVETDEEGRFELTGVAPGPRILTASAQQWADSLPLTVEVAPGDARTGADLALRIGGRIEGTVVTPEGDPEAGARVTWGSNPMGFGSRGETSTDAGGRFSFEHVTPGDWTVSTAPSLAELGERVRGRRGQSAFIEVMGEMLTKTITVTDGEVTEVSLGGEPKRPVRVFGVISRAGEPVADARVFAISEESAIIQGMKAATSAEDGSYELTVDRPGSYVLNANAGSSGVDAVVEIPRSDELRVDLAIPLGRIEGIVREPNASAAKGVRLSLQREDGLGRVRWAGNETRTGDDGRYAFEDLEQGTYTVRANTSSWGGSSQKNWGSALLSGIEVGADEVTSGIDFRLETSGGVNGLVLGPDGSPAAGVTVFFRDGAGRLVSSFSRTVTDAVGRFEQAGLAPGTYSVSARSSDLAAGDGISVAVRSEETAELELEVEVGTLLLVTLEGPDGKALRARVEVLDSEGSEVGGLLTASSLQATFSQGNSPLEQRVGPLPRGRYTVRATTPDGRSDEKRVSLRGRDAEKAILLRLEDE